MKHRMGACMRRCSAFFLTLVMVFSLVNMPAVSLEANAAAKKYTITYKLNGGKNSSKNPKTYKSTTKTIQLKSATRKGYTFGGWYTTSKFKKKVTKIAKGSKGNKTLYAKWKANSYTISFQGNGSTGGSTKKMSCKYGKSYKLTVNGFKKTGYKFDGWSTKQSGSGKNYKDRASVKNLTSKKGATVKLYARWQPISYTVSFDANGGQGTMDAMSCYYGLFYGLPVNTFTKSGMVFKGWNTKADGSGTTYLKDAQIHNLTKKDGDKITLYAQWMESGYIVSFNANGGSGTMADMECKFGRRYELPANVFECLGCEFTGWNTKPGGDGTSYGASGSFVDATKNDGETVVLYAQWKWKDMPNVSDSYTVTYVANASDATGFMDSVTYKAGETVTFPACGYTRTGYTFSAWNTKADGKGTAYRPNKTGTDIAGTESSIVLYARWTKNQYKITFNGNGGSGAMSDLSCVYDMEQQLTDNAFTRDGYEFAGWTTAADGSGQFYDDGQAIKNLSATDRAVITLYAQWDEIIIPVGPEPITTYTIKFSSNGGSGTMNAVSATINQSVNLEACAYQREGYVFKCWNTRPDGSGTEYKDKASVTNLGEAGRSATLYAQWTPITYSVVYNCNGGTGSIASTVCTYDVAVNLTDSVCTRGGYSFKEWNTKADGSGTAYASGSEIKNLTAKSGDTIILYAQWTEAAVQPNTYTIVFNANGGSGNMISMICYIGTAYALRVNTFTKDGYHFAGWNTKADGSGTVYSDSASIRDLVTVPGGSIELYAQWVKEVTTYKIRFGSNGGSGSMSDVTATNGVAFTLPANTFTRTGYSFKEWNTKADGSGTAYKNKASVTDIGTANTTVILYAQWSAEAVETKTYTIKFNANGGSGSMSSVTATRGSAYTLPANTFTRTGYSFKEWNTKADGSGTSYKNKASVTDIGAANATVTLYAQWNADAVETKTYTIKFNANGGTGTMANMTCDYDATYQIPANIYTRDGYEFTGWNTKAGGTGTSYAVGANVSKLVSENGGSITLYAQWKEIIVTPNTYVIAYNANGSGANGTMSNQTVSCGGQAVLSDNKFVRTGYSFKNWSTKADGSGTTYANKASVKDIASAGGTITLYAQWTPITYSIVFNSNGGTGTMSGMSCTYDTSYNLTKNSFTRAGYEFTGWKDASGNSYADGASVRNLASAEGTTVTLSAQWKEKTVVAGNYTVKFNGNGDAVTGTMSAMTIQVGASQALTACAYKNPGYTFKQWNTKADGSGTAYADKASVKNLAKEGESVTLYAQWTGIKYKIAFNANGGSGSMSTKSCTYGTSYPLTKNGFTKSGYKFSGWNTKADGSGTSYAEGASVSNLTTTADATVTFYAQWTKTDAKYTIVFNANGGSGTMSDITKSMSDSVTLPANTFTRENYTFGGWMLSKNGTAADYTDKATIKEPTVVNGKMTLYAYWIPFTYYIHFNDTSTTGDLSTDFTMTCQYGKSVSMPEGDCITTGYRVVKWNGNWQGTASNTYYVGSNYTKMTKADGTAVKSGETIELYPVCKEIEYTIIFRFNHSAVDSQAGVQTGGVRYSEDIETGDLKLLTSKKDVAVQQLSLVGATPQFVEWNTKPDGSGTSYKLGEPASKLCSVHNGEVILYAQWK